MQRPGGRSARVRSAVHEAVVDLMEEHPWEEMSVPLVAERSGVHQATIYRRWGSMSALVQDVLVERFTAGEVPDTGSLREDLRQYTTNVAESLADGAIPLILRATVMEIRPGESRESSPAFRAREQQLQVMLDRAATRGEQVPTVEELLDVLVAPLYFRALFAQPMPTAHADRLVDRLLDLAAHR
ncbi:DNA-binding transcriptional regulator, AcrR family [Actinopolymorpha singaporensis]|uniref:DNA-binding transcriptional regulator, AcrR family n=2 Tax=Actinopolymorpha singaporensis TaxID=117157 RepID=A0A1H1MKT3_9ACTN|nr:DNA-binding transcriptional regulator, AcrR family [Actinopolymorpha singaporensis]